MSRNEVKEKINDILDKLNDDKLVKALDVLKGIEKFDEDKRQDEQDSNLNKILKEDENLLNRLAQ